MQVELKDRREVRLAAVRHLGPYPRIAEAFQRLHAIAEREGLFHAGAEMLALYHDDPETTPVDQLRSDAALTVTADRSLPSDVTEMRLPGGRYACTTHIGPYTGLGDAWSRFMGEWLPASGHRVGDGPSFEIYRNTPANAPAEKLCTELYLPIA